MYRSISGSSDTSFASLEFREKTQAKAGRARGMVAFASALRLSAQFWIFNIVQLVWRHDKILFSVPHLLRLEI